MMNAASGMPPNPLARGAGELSGTNFAGGCWPSAAAASASPNFAGLPSSASSSGFFLYNPPTLGTSSASSVSSILRAPPPGPPTTLDQMFGQNQNSNNSNNGNGMLQPQQQHTVGFGNSQTQQQQMPMLRTPAFVGGANAFAMGGISSSSASGPSSSSFSGSFPYSLPPAACTTLSSAAGLIPCSAAAAVAAASFDGLIKQQNCSNPALQYNGGNTHPQHFGTGEMPPPPPPSLMSAIYRPPAGAGSLQNTPQSNAFSNLQSLACKPNGAVQPPPQLQPQQLFDLSNSIANAAAASSASASANTAASVLAAAVSSVAAAGGGSARSTPAENRQRASSDAGSNGTKTPLGMPPPFASALQQKTAAGMMPLLSASADCVKIPKETATIPLERPRGGSTSSSAGGTDQRSHSVSQQQQAQLSCQVCYLAASNGLHFGARTCAACAAFFRRSISDQKRYICKRSQRCVIRPGEGDAAQGYRKMCRNCRMKRCLDIGMLPENVQNKRNKRDFYFSDALHNAMQQQQQQQQMMGLATVKAEPGKTDEEEEEDGEEEKGKKPGMGLFSNGGGGGGGTELLDNGAGLGKQQMMGLMGAGDCASAANFRQQSQLQQMLMLPGNLGAGGTMGAPNMNPMMGPPGPNCWGITLREI